MSGVVYFQGPAGQGDVRVSAANPLPTTSGGGGGGGAVTVADGADATQGAVADAAYSGTGSGTVVSILKSIRALLAGTLTTLIGYPALPTATNRSGTATTTSGGLTVAANTSRRGLVGQNIGANNIGFNEFNGTAAIGTAGTYTVTPGSSFSISTQNAVNFIAATGSTAVTMTEY